MDKGSLVALIRRVGEGDEEAVSALEAAGLLVINVIESAGRFPAYKLAGMDIIGADLSGIQAVLSDFSGSDLSGANFTGAVLVGTSFVGADLSGAWFQGAVVVDTDFRDASLARAEFCGANCANAVFSGADLLDSKWTGATLVDGNFMGADNFDLVDFADASRLHGVFLPDGGRYDGRLALKGDMEDVIASGVNLNKLEQIADFYGVTSLQFIAGQGWASNDLPRLLRRRSGGSAG